MRLQAAAKKNSSRHCEANRPVRKTLREFSLNLMKNGLTCYLGISDSERSNRGYVFERNWRFRFRRPVCRLPEAIQRRLRAISLQLNNHTDRGVGRPPVCSSKASKRFKAKNNASPSDLEQSKNAASSLARRSERVARIIRPCHRRIYRVVLFRTTSCI